MSASTQRRDRIGFAIRNYLSTRVRLQEATEAAESSREQAEAEEMASPYGPAAEMARRVRDGAEWRRRQAEAAYQQACEHAGRVLCEMHGVSVDDPTLEETLQASLRLAGGAT